MCDERSVSSPGAVFWGGQNVDWLRVIPWIPGFAAVLAGTLGG